MINFQQGRYAEAQARCAELVALGRKLREGSEAPFANALQGLCAYAIDDTSAELDSALGLLRIADAKHRLAYVQTRAALLDYEHQRIEQALERGGEALACAEMLERTTEMMLAHLVLGLCYRAGDRLTEAARHFTSVDALEAAGVAEWARQMVRTLSGTGEKLQA
jgi:tetratricopeptide (TPR) repeat protein